MAGTNVARQLIASHLEGTMLPGSEIGLRIDQTLTQDATGTLVMLDLVAVDPGYPVRALAVRDTGGHALVAGRNYGQGSSREHAALAPRYLGLHLVIARGFARIHWQNLVNFGVLPLTLLDAAVYDEIEAGDVLQLRDIRQRLRAGRELELSNVTRQRAIPAHHDLSARQVDVLLAGGLINWMRDELVASGPGFAPASSAAVEAIA